MKCSLACLAAAACLPWASARALPASKPNAELFLVETAPGETKWVSEEGKWELIRRGQHFMDITNYRNLGSPTIAKRAVVTYPQNCTHQNEVAPLAKLLDKSRMESTLKKFSSFHTRFHDSDYGRQSGEWLLQHMVSMVKEAGARDTVIVKDFLHSWLQNSIMVTIPGRTNNTIIIGAHQDSLNSKLPHLLRSPGADDDGSGTVTIMEVLRILLTSKDIIAGKAENTIEFHWYSAEEAGLLGSQEIFQFYQEEKRDIKAMLQQDMTGYIEGLISNNKKECIGVITDFVDQNLTQFIKTAIEEYCDIPWVETRCGYACSDHAAAFKAGFPSAFAIESPMEFTNPTIHTAQDSIEHLSFDHMLQHARMTLGVVYELAFYDFSGQHERKSREPGSQGRVNDAKGGVGQCLDL